MVVTTAGLDRSTVVIISVVAIFLITLAYLRHDGQASTSLPSSLSMGGGGGEDELPSPVSLRSRTEGGEVGPYLKRAHGRINTAIVIDESNISNAGGPDSCGPSAYTTGRGFICRKSFEGVRPYPSELTASVASSHL